MVDTKPKFYAAHFFWNDLIINFNNFTPVHAQIKRFSWFFNKILHLFFKKLFIKADIIRLSYFELFLPFHLTCHLFLPKTKEAILSGGLCMIGVCIKIITHIVTNKWYVHKLLKGRSWKLLKRSTSFTLVIVCTINKFPFLFFCTF